MINKKKRMSAAERRAQLIEVGRSVFAKTGFEATTVEEIAGEAGVSKPVVYEHFGGKEGLYAVVIDREMENVVAMITRSISEGTPRERAEKAVLSFLTYVRDEPDGFAVLCQDAPLSMSGGGLTSMLNVVAERVGEVFVMSLKESGFSTKYAPIYAHALIGMVTFVGQWWTETRSPSVEKVASHLMALSWMGLRHLPRQPDPIKAKKKRRKSK